MIFVTIAIGILKILFLSSRSILCNSSHDLMQKTISFDIVAIVYVKGSAYRINFWYMSKNDAINIRNSSNLADKKSVL